MLARFFRQHRPFKRQIRHWARADFRRKLHVQPDRLRGFFQPREIRPMLIVADVGRFAAFGGQRIRMLDDFRLLVQRFQRRAEVFLRHKAERTHIVRQKINGQHGGLLLSGG